MRDKLLVLMATCVASLGLATPSFAASDAVKDIASLGGTSTALVVDVPEGMVVDSLYRAPKKTASYLADKFGDPKGLSENLVGALIGFPVGFAWGLPYGAIHGGRRAFSTGWEKPFSTESYLVSEEK
jgi:hypothetical protein